MKEFDNTCIWRIKMGKKVEIYQLTPNKNVLMQCQVIKTKNDKIIVIDGGYYDEQYCYYIHSAIRAILGLKQNDYFEIECWILTHDHEDHLGEMGLQFEKYTKESNFKVNNIYFDFADITKMNYGDGKEMLPWNERFIKALDNYAKVDGIQILSDSFYNDINGKFINKENIDKGCSIVIDGIEIEFLQTYDALDEIINSSSLVFKMTVKDDYYSQSVMFLGDTSVQSGKRLLETVEHKKLKSDIVQMAHHGNWACEKQVYDTIDAKVRLWPTPLWVWNGDKNRFDIHKVCSWFNTTGASKNDIISCLYEEYPVDKTSVEDWKKVISKMKITLPYNLY